MHLGWFFLIPLSIVNVMALGVGLLLHGQAPWSFVAWLKLLGISTVPILLVALYLARVGQQRSGVARSEA